MSNNPDIAARRFEQRFAEWVVRARWAVIAISLALVTTAACGGAFLQFSSDYRLFFDGENPELRAFEALEDTYGKNNNLLFMIAPDDGDATSEGALEAAVWLTERAWQTPYSRRVDSIANFQHTAADGDELSVSNLVDPQKLGDPKERARVRAIALADPRLAGSLLARDASVSAVNVTVEVQADEDAFKVAEIVEFGRRLADEAEERFPGIGIRTVGMVMIAHSFSEASIDSQIIFLPACLAIMAVVLAFLTRSLAGVAATGLVIVFSVLASMGMGGWAGLPFSAPAAPAPTIVLMIVVANCVHQLVTLRQRMQAGDPKSAAIVESIRVNLQPVFVASVTTALGFLAMNFSEVPPYRHLGNFVAFGIGASFLLSVTFLPALLSLLPMRAPPIARDGDPAMAAMARFVLRRRKALLWGSAAVVLAMLAALPRNELSDALLHFFDESVEFRQDMDFLDQRLSGNTQFEYSLAATGPGGVADPAFLANIAAFADWCRRQPETRHVQTVTDTFRQLNKSMHGDDPSFYRLPASGELAAQYLLLYELSLPRGLDLNHRIDIDKSATRVTVTTGALSSKDVLGFDARAKAWLKGNAPHIVRAESSGPPLLFAHIGERNIRAMLVATAAAMLGISVILIAALRSLPLGLISLVPNFVPGIIGFGIWALISGQVGVGLSVVVAMTMGIVVDDTVHFLSKYLRARREQGCSPEDAVRHAFQAAGRALFTTTVVLAAGFMILLLAPLIPTAEVGLLSAIIIAAALAADLLLLPPLLLVIDRAGTRTARPSA